LIQRKVDWVFAYDSERVVANSAAVLGRPVPKRPVCRTLDRTPAQSPFFLSLAGQNPVAKLFRVVNNR
jgi:hypothetical protein